MQITLTSGFFFVFFNFPGLPLQPPWDSKQPAAGNTSFFLILLTWLLMAITTFARRIGASIKKLAAKKGAGAWHTPHMAAAACAILERIPLVDLVLQVRDARIPLSSEYSELRKYSSSSRQILVLNKMDLASQSEVKAWMKYFEEKNCISYGVNSHNKENIKEFLNFLQKQVRELKRTDQSSYTATIMLVGIPNVGKSALANALHRIGRIGAAGKGKLKNAIVSPEPGETKDISSLKIGSHPNIYVLDTPGVLPPEIPDIDICSKLALTGSFQDYMVGKKLLAEYFLAILNSSEVYKKWGNICTKECGHELDLNQKRRFHDHTQDFMVHDVRRTLFNIISSFNGSKEDEAALTRLIAQEFSELQKTFQVCTEFHQDAHEKVAEKLLDLFYTGRLGHYVLDTAPRDT